MSKDIKLTEKQKIFCEEYLIDLNGTQAAIRAGYSEKTAEVQASKMLRYPKVRDRIEELKKKRIEKTEITAESVLEDLKLARDITLGLEPHKIVSNAGGMPISVDVKKTDINNFVKINELYMKHLGMFEKDNEQKTQNISVVLSDNDSRI